MKTLYFEAFSGISGDMTVASLLDMGLIKKEYLLEELEKLHLDGYSIDIHEDTKRGIRGSKFDVLLHEHEHHHEHEHEHEHEHHHEHRALSDIMKIINSADITDGAKAMANKIFTLLAQAEAKAHGVPVNEVHFHEVGAVDSIVDIVSAAILIDALKPDKITCSRINEGQGFAWCQHGKMPVPVPATANIFAMCDIPYSIIDADGEMVTPTGAAIVGALCQTKDAKPSGCISAIGTGCGTKDFEHANILRTYLIAEQNNGDNVAAIETNIDDMSGEELAYAAELLRTNGALDVFYTPIYMKKNRPAYMLTLLCKDDADEIRRFTELIFKHTSTIGVRFAPMNRMVMARESAMVQTRFGELQVKKCSFGKLTKIKAEYDSAAQAAGKHDAPIREVMAEAEK